MQQKIFPDKPAFTIAELTPILSKSQLYIEIRSGRLRARKIGAKTVILRADLERWLGELPEKPRTSEIHRERALRCRAVSAGTL
jgi:hypothetical protein